MGGASMNARLGRFIHDMLISIDQSAGCWLRGWFYVFGLASEPNPDETISSWVGRNAVIGKQWAIIAEKFIDALFGAGHCRREIGT